MSSHVQQHLKRQVIDSLDRAAHGSLLDLACADGVPAARFKDRFGGTVTGVQPDPDLAPHAEAHIDHVVNRFVDDLELSDLPAAAFDAVLCLDALEKCRTPLHLLKKCRHWVKPCGQLIVSFANSRHHETIAKLIRGDDGTVPSAEALFTRLSFEQLAFRSGWRVDHRQAFYPEDHQEWVQKGHPARLQFSAFSTDVSDAIDAAEFFVSSYLFWLSPVSLPEYPLTSVILRTSSYEATLECLETLSNHTDEPVELIVAAPIPDEDLRLHLSGVKNIAVVTAATGQTSTGNLSEAFRLCSGDQILVIDDRCRVSTGWLRDMLDALYDDPSNAVVGPVYGRDFPAGMVATLSAAGGLASFAWSQRRNRRLTIMDRIDESCVLFRSEYLREAGLLQSEPEQSVNFFSRLFQHVAGKNERVLVARNVYVHLADSQPIPDESDEVTSGRGTGFIDTSAASRPASGSACPDEKRLLSLCMIVRDNEDTIEASLASIRPWVDEIVVVDTGSVDRTPEICARFDVKLYNFPWCDDFSAARNVSLGHATGDWIFWMDSDDVIPESQGRLLRGLVDGDHQSGCMGYVLKVHCVSSMPNQLTVVDHVKVFRNLPELRFEFRIHEQILPSIRRAGGMVRFTDIYVEHQGSMQTADRRARKLERDFRILALELEDRPEHPFTLFNLGMTCEDAGRYEEAIAHFRKCVELSGPGESHFAKAWALLVSSLNSLGRIDEALAACSHALEIFPGDPELQFRRAGLYQVLMRYSEAEADYRHVLNFQPDQRFRSFDPLICTAKAHHNLGTLLHKQGRLAESAEHLRLAIEGMESFGPSWLALARVLDDSKNLSELSSLATSLADKMVEPQSTAALVSSLIHNSNEEFDQLDELLTEAWQATGDPECLDELARMLTEAGRFQRAREVLGSLLNVRPDDASVLFNFGSLSYHLGNREAGLQSLRKAISLRPEAAYINDRLKAMETECASLHGKSSDGPHDRLSDDKAESP